MKTAAIYARYSSSRQREASIEDQVRECTEWCAKHGYAVVATYADRACSGRTDERPEFQRMIANAGESDIVLVYMMDRFSRDVYDAPIYKKRLRDHGVKVVSVCEAMPDDMSALLLENMYEALAAMESERISLRTRRGMEGNALKCMHNGVPVYGYSFAADGTYEVDEAQASHVRDAFRLRADGCSENSIARRLASQGVTTTRGRPANYNFIHHMLGNRKYIGVYSWGGVEIDGGMPRIVDDELFDSAQEAVSVKRRKNEHWGDFALSGKLLCGSCLRSMVGASGRGRNGVKYEYYKCNAGCGVRPMRRDELEAAVADGVRAMLADESIMESIAQAVEACVADDGTVARRDAAERRIRDAERAIRSLTEAVRSGMPYEDVADEYEALKIEILAAKNEYVTYAEASTFDADDFIDFVRCAAQMDEARLIDALVWQVRLDDDEITVTLNYDMEDGTAPRVRAPRGSYDSQSGVADSENEKVRTTSDGESDMVLTVPSWLPVHGTRRNMRVGIVDGRVAIRMLRAA